MVTATDFTYRGLAQDVVSGHDVISTLDAHWERLDVNRAMVLCGPGVLHGSDVVERVEASLRGRLAGRFAGACPHAPLDVLMAAADAAREIGPDTRVSVGGGSTVDLAKGVALLLSTDRDVHDFKVSFVPPGQPAPPPPPIPPIDTTLVSVSTTMGCADIGRSGGGFADRERGEKLVLGTDGATSPKLIVIDGRALATTPEGIQRSTAVGQLRLAVESYNAVKNNPVGDALALHAIRLLVEVLDEGWRRESDYLLRVKSAACLSSLALTAVGTLGLNSAMGHQIGAVYDVPHGEANAVMLPHTLRFNSGVIPPSRLALLADAFGVVGEDPLGDALAGRVRSLCEGLELPLRLRDVGVPQSGLASIARATMGDRQLAGNPRRVTVEDVLSLLHAAW